jgi:hypothetical protein
MTATTANVAGRSIMNLDARGIRDKVKGNLDGFLNAWLSTNLKSQ